MIKRLKFLTGYTLTEVIATAIIIAILAAVAVPLYKASVDHIKRREAFLALQLLAVAEKVYFNQNNHYWPEMDASINMDNINNALGTDVRRNAHWIYCVKETRILGPTYIFTGYAISKGSPRGDKIYFVSTRNGALPGEPQEFFGGLGATNCR